MRRRQFLGLGAASVAVLIGNNALAGTVDCSKYFGKGYCIDHIKNKTGKKQSGDAKNWRGNINKTDVRKGDVAIFNFGSWGHVAYVESVTPAPGKGKVVPPKTVTVSEMNWKMPLDSCLRGPNFGVVTTRTIDVNTPAAYWRP